MKKEPLLKVKIFWLPIIKEVFLEDKVLSISAKNKLGNFDVLPNHANFITIILDNLSIVTKDKKRISYKFKRGLLEVNNDQVKIFLGL
jgi:F0F1-type ATP synthase epsilon subunit